MQMQMVHRTHTIFNLFIFLNLWDTKRVFASLRLQLNIQFITLFRFVFDFIAAKLLLSFQLCTTEKRRKNKNKQKQWNDEIKRLSRTHSSRSIQLASFFRSRTNITSTNIKMQMKQLNAAHYLYIPFFLKAATHRRQAFVVCCVYVNFALLILRMNQRRKWLEEKEIKRRSW